MTGVVVAMLDDRGLKNLAITNHRPAYRLDVAKRCNQLPTNASVSSMLEAVAVSCPFRARLCWPTIRTLSCRPALLPSCQTLMISTPAAADWSSLAVSSICATVATYRHRSV